MSMTKVCLLEGILDKLAKNVVSILMGNLFFLYWKDYLISSLKKALGHSP